MHKLNHAVRKAFLEILCDGDVSGLRGYQLTNPLCPLDDAQSVSIKIIFIADFLHLVNLPNAVYIKVVKGQPAALIGGGNFIPRPKY